MAQTITKTLATPGTLVGSAAWQALFAGARTAEASGVLIRNTSSSAVEIGDATQATALSATGWYQIPANSTMFVPFPPGNFPQVYAKGAGAAIYFQDVVVSY